VLAFLLVFFGIRSYRENVSGGYISFGRAFGVGILIMLISILCYVVTWEIVHFNFYPDFAMQHGNYLMEKARASGATAEELTQQAEQVKYYVELYKNPLYVAAFTVVEQLPIGLLMTLISAAILRKRRKEELVEPGQLNETAA
jgi:hypothetical protein